VTANGLKGPRNVSLSPDGRFAYVPSSVSGTIDVFAVHAAPVAPFSRRVFAARRRQLRMPKLTGLRPAKAKRRMRRLLGRRLRFRAIRRYARRRPKHARRGRVFRQWPRRNARLRRGSRPVRVRVVVYAGRRRR
jgi:hypothetical protein